MSQTKYTRELLEPLVKESISVAQVLRKLGLKEAGGTHSHISKTIKQYELDTSHFLGQASNCGETHKGGPEKKEWHEVLIERQIGRRQAAVRLRKALIESGREYKCEECKQLPWWNEKELRLQVDHKNGNWLDDRPDNVRFLCSNCHSQTKGFSGSKGYAEIATTAQYSSMWGRRMREKKREEKREEKKQK